MSFCTKCKSFHLYETCERPILVDIRHYGARGHQSRGRRFHVMSAGEWLHVRERKATKNKRSGLRIKELPPLTASIGEVVDAEV